MAPGRSPESEETRMKQFEHVISNGVHPEVLDYIVSIFFPTFPCGLSWTNTLNPEVVKLLFESTMRRKEKYENEIDALFQSLLSQEYLSRPSIILFPLIPLQYFHYLNINYDADLILAIGARTQWKFNTFDFRQLMPHAIRKGNPEVMETLLMTSNFGPSRRKDSCRIEQILDVVTIFATSSMNPFEFLTHQHQHLRDINKEIQTKLTTFEFHFAQFAKELDKFPTLVYLIKIIPTIKETLSIYFFQKKNSTTRQRFAKIIRDHRSELPLCVDCQFYDLTHEFRFQ